MLTIGQPLSAMFLEDWSDGHAINKKELYWRKPDNSLSLFLYMYNNEINAKRNRKHGLNSMTEMCFLSATLLSIQMKGTKFTILIYIYIYIW